MIAFIITLALTPYMSGMIWSMQILEYPLFALVGRQEFPSILSHDGRKKSSICTIVHRESLFAKAQVKILFPAPSGASIPTINVEYLFGSEVRRSHK